MIELLASEIIFCIKFNENFKKEQTFISSVIEVYVKKNDSKKIVKRFENFSLGL